MSNFTEKHNKLARHLQELYKKHRTLDDEIQISYKSFEKEEIVNRMNKFFGYNIVDNIKLITFEGDQKSY